MFHLFRNFFYDSKVVLEVTSLYFNMPELHMGKVRPVRDCLPKLALGKEGL